jgi:hypothetical protein
MLTHAQMLVSGHPRPTNGKFVMMRGDQVQQPSAVGTITVAPHTLPLPSGSYVDNGGEGRDIARVWLTPADFAALCSCLSMNETEISLAHNGSVVTAFSFTPVAAPLQSMAQTLKALERRMNALEVDALRADVAAIREGVEELLRRLPELRHSDVVPRAPREGERESSTRVPSSKKAG